MWSKGAVVVKKHGDDAMADAIEKGINDGQYTLTVDPEWKTKMEWSDYVRKKHDKEMYAKKIKHYNKQAKRVKQPSKLVAFFIGWYAFLASGLLWRKDLR